MKARFVMNQSNAKSNNPSQISQDMLILNGELNSGMAKENSSFYYNKNSGNDHHYQRPNNNTPHQNYSPTNAYARQSLTRYSNNLDGLEPVNDQMRKRPFTIPVVRVEINCDNPLEQSTVKTRQSHVSYIQ